MADFLSAGIVVIGRNEGARLLACLESIACLDLPMVYVDSASTDGSQAAARKAGALVVNLDLTFPFTAARARSEGARSLLRAEPDLEYIQFIDGDCVLVSTWIAEAQKFLVTSPQHAVVCGRRRERVPNASPYNRMADLEWCTPIGEAAACGGDSLVRTSAYNAVGGFDPSLIAGEEPELCSRLRTAGWRIERLDADMTVHDAAMTRLSQWWKRAVRSGFGYAQAWQATRDGPHPLYNRELFRAASWTIIPPLLSITGGMFLAPLLWMAAPVIYAGQIVRLAVRFGASHSFSWQRAGLLTLGKVAEMWGALRYLKRMAAGEAGSTIAYK